MKFRNAVAVSFILAVLSASVAVAQVTGVVSTKLGGLVASNTVEPWGYIRSNLADSNDPFSQGLGKSNGTGLGYMFSAPAEVVSMNITLADEEAKQGFYNANTRAIDGFWVYANGSPVPVGMVKWNKSLGDWGTQNNLPIWNLQGTQQITVTANWVTVAPFGTAFDTINRVAPVTELSFNGAAYVPTGGGPNLPHNFITPVSAAVLSNGANCPLLIDGVLHGSDNNPSYFWHSTVTGRQGFAITYASGGVNVQSVGFALFGNEGGNRVAPECVTILGYKPGSTLADYSADVYLNDVQTYYNRYDLKDSDGAPIVFAGVSRLEILFPESSSSAWLDKPANANWYYGLTEFQAFSNTVPNAFTTNVPEPATMSLLALGGLALLRRWR